MATSATRTVYLPHIDRTVRLGRRRPVARCPRLSFTRYLTSSLPEPPASCDYTQAAARSLGNVYLNDTLGICVIAGGFHVKGVVTANAGQETVFTDQQAVQDYSAIGGYVPGNPATDQGCDEQTALNYWVQHGFPDGTKLTAWMAVDPRDARAYRAALYLFENLYYGAGLPDAWLNTPEPGFVWDAGVPDANNGHCFVAAGYDARGTRIDTWGMLGTLTDAAHARDIDELYVLLDEQVIDRARGRSASGVDWAALVADWNAIGGSVPTPGPGPSPAPAPAKVFSLSFPRPVAKGGLIYFRSPVALAAGDYDVVHGRPAQAGDHPVATALEGHDGPEEDASEGAGAE